MSGSEDHVVLTPEQIAKTEMSFARVDAGEGLTMNEANERPATLRREWLIREGLAEMADVYAETEREWTSVDAEADRLWGEETR